MKKNMINTVFPNANKNNGIVFSEEKLNSNSKLKAAVWQEVKQAQYKFLIFYKKKKFYFFIIKICLKALQQT